MVTCVLYPGQISLYLSTYVVSGPYKLCEVSGSIKPFVIRSGDSSMKFLHVQNTYYNYMLMFLISLQIVVCYHFKWLLIDALPTKCGNFVLEDEEQCDAGINRNDKCCNDQCMLKPGANCRFGVCIVHRCQKQGGRGQYIIAPQILFLQD